MNRHIINSNLASLRIGMSDNLDTTEVDYSMLPIPPPVSI